MKVFLIIMFEMAGGPTMIEGWLPREHISMEKCVELSRTMKSYVAKSSLNLPDIIAIGCYEGETVHDAVARAVERSGEGA